MTKKTETETKPKAARTMKAFNLPRLAEIKMPAAGSKRLVAHDLLAREQGASMEEVMEATGWNRRNTAEGIRLLNKHNGLGLVQGEDGRIRLA